MADPYIRHASPYGGDYVDLPRATTTVFKKGWFLSLESNAVVNMNAATEDVTFAGLAYTNHINGDDRDVTAILKCIAQMDVASSTFGFAEGVKYSAGSATVDYSVIADSDANTIAWSWAEETAAVTRLLVDVDVRGLKSFGDDTKLYNVRA